MEKVLGARDHEDRGRRPEIRDQISEVGDWKSELGGQVRYRETEVSIAVAKTADGATAGTRKLRFFSYML
jgi:hypothetical protein